MITRHKIVEWSFNRCVRHSQYYAIKSSLGNYQCNVFHGEKDEMFVNL